MITDEEIAELERLIKVDDYEFYDHISGEFLSALIERLRAAEKLRHALVSLEVAANTAMYCYEKPIAQGRFAESMVRLYESTKAARRALAGQESNHE